MNRAEVWDAVADERRRLADELADVPRERFDRPTLCGTWSAKVVVAHLAHLAELNHRTATVDVMRGGLRVNRFIDRAAEATADGATVDELIDRLRNAAGGRYHAPGLPATAALGEVFAHRADMAGALELAPRPADERTATVLELYRGRFLGRFFGVPSSARTVRLVPNDGGPAVGPDDGPEATGPGDALVLALAGRPDALDALEGPGVARLAKPSR